MYSDQHMNTSIDNNFYQITLIILLYLPLMYEYLVKFFLLCYWIMLNAFKDLRIMLQNYAGIIGLGLIDGWLCG